MSPRRLLALWIGVIGEMMLITAELLDSTDDADYLAIDEVTESLRALVVR